ncbi:UDP-N-acetylmuramate dehydrogenase [soil metagenome]
MDFHPNVLLKNFTTMRLGGPASFMAEARTPDEVAEIYRQAKSQSLPVFVLGGGSNVIANDDGYKGIVLRMRIPGFEVIADDLNTTTIKIGAGESWDDTVKRIVDMHLSGVSALSAIPGTTGATPVQNIGAYGQEIADTLQSLEAYDSQTDSFVTLQNDDCEFSYRDSIFRRRETGRYVITSITLKLSKTNPQPPFYDALQKYFDEHNIQSFTQEIVRNAVTDIRTNKLPDPKLLPNTGSFFKNSIVEKWKLDELRTTYPDMPAYEMSDGTFKLSTGWLIEKSGLKGVVLHGMRVHDKNSLVLINESATSYHDLVLAREEIIGKVRDTFGVQIEQEPLEI